MPMDLDKVKTIMQQQQVTMTRLADYLHVQRPNLYRLLAGSDPKLSTCERVAEALGIDLGDILTPYKKPYKK